jgi:1-deoxy-D-xylulose-5-phosphate reductoisomerase
VREIVVLGSTGSIGTQTLDLVRRNPDLFRIVGLAAGGGRIDDLAQQALEFNVEVVAVAKATAAQDLLLAFYAAARANGYDAGGFAVPKLLIGPDAATELAAWPCDIVVNAMTGLIGLAPTLAALDAGRTLALANKESLIAGGELVLARLGGDRDRLLPVDSEHSAIAQCLRAGTPTEVQRLILTASGGPFRGRTRAEMGDVTVEQAMRHPTWDMGPLITINSATLVNKGLEVIEAHLLFGVPYDRIDVVVHPQSIVHSMVEFVDGSTIAQASPPDMRLPIGYALAWPDRLPGAAKAIDWTSAPSWEFEALDDEAFPAVALARAAGKRGSTAPAVYAAANEAAVAAFVAGTLKFTAIVDVVSTVVQAHNVPIGDVGIDDIVDAQVEARAMAAQLITEVEGRSR